MITQNSISSAAPLVEKLEANRKVARPLHGSTLEQLCVLKMPYGVTDQTGDNGAVTDTCNCDTEEHKSTLNYITDISASAVQNLLYNTKNVVVPMIQQLVDGYHKYVDAAITGSVNNIVVKPVFYHEFWNNPVVLSMVEKYDGVPVNKVSLTLKFPAKTAEELAIFIKTGSARFDAEMADYFDGLSKQFGFDALESVYNNVFSFEGISAISNLDDLINPFNGQRDSALVTLMLATRLMQAIPEGMNISLEQYQAYVSAIVEQAGRAVMRAIQQTETDIKNKTMIVSYPNTPFGNPYIESVIQVNGKVYNEWLNEGGSPEVLFGAYASNKERGYNSLLSMKDEYLKIWDREKRLIESKVRFEMKNVKSTALRKAFFEVISGLTEEQQRLPIADIVSMSDNLIDHMSDESFESIYKYARKLICRSAFPGSEYEDLLSAIDAAAAANPGIDEREAALLAVIEYVSGWVASQVKCEGY